MAGIPQTILLEQPREVDVIAIERELAQLWKRATDEGEDSAGSPVVRACMLNLVVFTETASRLQAIEELIGDVTLEHPARIFLIHADRNAQPSMLEAWITARCSLPVPGGKQVCCEQITITAHGADTRKVPSVVASLLVPDVPSVLLWKAGVDSGDRLFVALNELVDRVLIDSSEEPDPIPLLRHWLTFTGASRREGEFGDLAWSHLNPWRLAIAQAFNPVELRQSLQAISRLEITYSNSRQPIHGGLSQSLLISAWLASRLQWQISRPIRTGSAYEYSAEASSAGGPVALHIEGRSLDHPGPGGIEEVRIVTRQGPEITLSSGEDRSCIRSRQKASNGVVSDSVLWARDRDESSVLSHELEVLVRDELYEATGRVLASLLSDH